MKVYVGSAMTNLILSPRVLHLQASLVLSSKEYSCNTGDMRSTPGSGRSPKEMETLSSILAWEIPWTEEPGRLQSKESQRVRRD